MGSSEAPAPKQISMRVTLEEERAIRAAAAALRLSLSDLVLLGGLEACHRMGLQNPRAVPANLRPFTDAPVREASTRVTLNVRAPLLHHALFSRAADLSDLPLSNFMVGATLRSIARHQKLDPGDQRLAAVVLPRQYGGRR
jgi:uncharacterized protein (DUF1778 family)